MQLSTLISFALLAAFLLQPSPASTQLSVDAEIDWILQRQVPGTGAFLIAQQGSWVNPYFTNIALSNVLRLSTQDKVKVAVKKWIGWYISKLYHPTAGVALISDWDSYPNGTEASRNYADSTDSYGATFLSLVTRFYYASGDRAYIRSIIPTLQQIAEGILTTFKAELNLTCARKDYCVYYLMDNVEVWKGFLDFSDLLSDVLEPVASVHWRGKADAIRHGIETNIFDSSLGYYRDAYYVDGRNPTDWSGLTPGTLSNMYAQAYRLPEAMEAGRRTSIYQRFSGAPLQRWINRRFTEGQEGTDFPLAYAAEAAALNADFQSVDQWKQNVNRLWFPKRDWTWNIADCALLLIHM